MPNYVTNVMIPLNEAAKVFFVAMELMPNGFSFENIVPGSPKGPGEAWYKWNIKNWGTKWDVCERVMTKEGCLQFDTAWSTPLPIYEAIAKQYPDVKFRVLYADEDVGSNLGVLHIKDGRVVYEEYEDLSNATKIAHLNEMKHYGHGVWFVPMTGFITKPSLMRMKNERQNPNDSRNIERRGLH